MTTKRLMVLSALAALAACSSADEMGDAIGVAEAKAKEAAQESAQQTLDRRVPAGVEPVTFRDEQTDGKAKREFAYSWPAQAAAIPDLNEVLDIKLRRALESQQTDWEFAIEDFGNGTGEDACLTCVTRSYALEWTVVADTPRFLALRGDLSTYTGGAHGSTRFETLLWDRKVNAEEVVYDIFTDTSDFEEAAYSDYCDALARAWAQKRQSAGSDYSGFTSCDGPSVSDIVFTSSDSQKIDGILFLIPPYQVGPYAEGTYEFEIAVSPDILSTIKPEFREAFAIGAG